MYVKIVNKRFPDRIYEGKLLHRIDAGVFQVSDDILKKYYKTDNVAGFRSCARMRIILERNDTGSVVILTINDDMVVRYG